MAYTDTNFKTKKALKEAVAKAKEGGPAVTCHQPGMGPDLTNFTGNVALEGPHYPQPHTWYASATLANGCVVKVS